MEVAPNHLSEVVRQKARRTPTGLVTTIRDGQRDRAMFMTSDKRGKVSRF
jgi:hypothetical protein